jgi:hypothetical protein
MAAPKVFISYSHDSSEHYKWVRELATAIRKQGVDATLDQWDLKPGQDLAGFMHEGIANADRVIMVCSENYVTKAEAGVGGVGYERLIVTSEVSANIDTKKFVPIIRNNFSSKKIPNFLGSRFYIDFIDDEAYDSSLEMLVRDLHGVYKHEKPELGVLDFTAFSNDVVTPQVGIRELQSLDADWFNAQAERADKGLAVIGFDGSMEVRAVPDHSPSATQHKLLSAVEASEIRTFGWPIGITLHNLKGASPRPTADGVRAEVAIPLSDSRTGKPSYDYWAIAEDGKFYTQINLFEDDRGKGLLFFNTRIIRVAEAIMFLVGVYSHLGLPTETRVRLRVKHKGLNGRTLQAAGPNRNFRGRVTEESLSSTEVDFQLFTVDEELPRIVQRICAPMFVLFEFMEFSDAIYDDIVRRFQKGEAS